MFIATRDASGSTPVALWSFTTGGAVDSSPVLSNDGSTLYVQSNEDGQRQLYAIYALNGSKMWSSPTGDAAKYSGGKQGYNPVLNSAVNIVYVKNDEYLYALDAVSGATNYIIDVGAGSSSNGGTPAVSNDGQAVYAGGCLKDNCSYMFAYDALTGTNIWSTTDGKTAYSGSWDWTLNAVNTTNQSVVWTSRRMGGNNYQTPTLSSDGTIVFVGNLDKHLYADCKRVDYCYEKPCVHGMCTNGNSSYACRCSPGWLGYDCSDVDYCYKETCSDRGTCHIIDASSTAGHHSFKTVRVLVAASENSTTAITTKSPAFRIKATGAATAAGSDRSNPKSVLGTSNSLRIKARATRGSGYQCDCNPGFTGRNCENTYCTGETCSGHGKCVNEDDGHYCDCTPGFVGDECADTYCSGETCSGHGSCTNGDKGYTCHCTREYFGKQCGMKVLYGALFGVVSVVLVVLIVVWWLRRRNVKYEKVKESNARLQNVQNTIYEEMSEPTHGNDNRNRTRSNRRFEANLYEQVQAEPFQPPPPSAPPAVLPARYAGDARGAPRAWQCPVCNTTIPGGHNFCRTCGTAMHQSING
eukprot:gene5380-13352_t